MSRDHRKVRVSKLADELAVDVYTETARFPHDERFEIRAQVRRAAVSAAANGLLREEVYRELEPKYSRLISGLKKLT